MNIEQESQNVEREVEWCRWCGMSDREEKVYASPGDDIENPKAYHKDCFESLQAFMLLIWGRSDEPLEKLMDMADRISGNTRRKKVKEIERKAKRRKKNKV